MNISPELYPFAEHWLDLGGYRMHYVDEGSGEPVVMVHGNPTWSFYYRDVIKALSGRFRCVVPDHVGCGKSDLPSEDVYDYHFEQRADDLETLLDSLDIREGVTLILHDWGGMIGMLYATRHPERIKRIVLLNTAAFHLPGSKAFPWQLWLTRTPLGTVLARGLNAFSWGAAKFGVTKRKLTPEEEHGYLAPYHDWQSRLAVLRFVQDIPLAPGDRGFDVISEAASRLHLFRDRPVLICWGLKDFVFDVHFLRVWREYLPHAEVHEFPEAGHYVLEDEKDAIIPLIRRFLGMDGE